MPCRCLCPLGEMIIAGMEVDTEVVSVAMGMTEVNVKTKRSFCTTVQASWNARLDVRGKSAGQQSAELKAVIFRDVCFDYSVPLIRLLKLCQCMSRNKPPHSFPVP